jgi:transforming growth factor-beta-induced protein
MLETARNRPELSTIVSLFEDAGFEDIFSCPGPFTGFFPTNAAIDALDPDIVEFLTDPANVDALRGLLLYHLLGGENTVSDLADGAPKDEETLLPDETVQIEPATNGSAPVTVNGNQIVTSDVEACNGVIQVIDGVLIPGPGKSIFELIRTNRKSLTNCLFGLLLQLQM